MIRKKKRKEKAAAAVAAPNAKTRQSNESMATGEDDCDDDGSGFNRSLSTGSSVPEDEVPVTALVTGKKKRSLNGTTKRKRSPKNGNSSLAVAPPFDSGVDGDVDDLLTDDGHESQLAGILNEALKRQEEVEIKNVPLSPQPPEVHPSRLPVVGGFEFDPNISFPTSSLIGSLDSSDGIDVDAAAANVAAKLPADGLPKLNEEDLGKILQDFDKDSELVSVNEDFLKQEEVHNSSVDPTFQRRDLLDYVLDPFKAGVFLKQAYVCWENAIAMTSLRPNFEQALCDFHCGRCSSQSLSRQLLQGHLENFVGRVFKEFAARQPDFALVLPSANDRAALLSRNAPLMAQYVLARYLGADSGLEQVNWMLLGRRSAPPPTPLRRTNLSAFSRAFDDLFFNRDSLESYEDCVRLVVTRRFNNTTSTAQPIPFYCNCLVALTCLFSAKGVTAGLSADGAEVAQRQLEYVYAAADATRRQGFQPLSGEDLVRLVDVLETMCVIFNKGRVSTAPECEAATVATLYSDHDEEWIQSRLGVIRDTYDTVPFGEEIVREYVLYNLEVPFSRRFMPGIAAVWAERYRAVFRNHPEFGALRDAQQSALCAASAFDAVALTIVRQESCATGNQQVEASFGGDDKALLASYTSTPFLAGATLKKISIKDVNSSLHHLDANSYRYCMHKKYSTFTYVE